MLSIVRYFISELNYCSGFLGGLGCYYTKCSLNSELNIYLVSNFTCLKESGLHSRTATWNHKATKYLNIKGTLGCSELRHAKRSTHKCIHWLFHSCNYVSVWGAYPTVLSMYNVMEWKVSFTWGYSVVLKFLKILVVIFSHRALVSYW